LSTDLQHHATAGCFTVHLRSSATARAAGATSPEAWCALVIVRSATDGTAHHAEHGESRAYYEEGDAD
jgi:hypothetical protein